MPRGTGRTFAPSWPSIPPCLPSCARGSPVRAELGSHPAPAVVALVCAREMGLFDDGGEEWEEPFEMGVIEVEPLDMSLLELPAAPAKPKGKRNVLITGNLVAVG